MPGNGHWNPGALIGPGSLYGAAAVGVPVGIGVVAYAMSSSPALFGGFMIGALCVAIGVALGSTANSAVGVAICGLVAGTTSATTPSMILVGIGLFATMVLHDLSMSSRRGTLPAPVIRSTGLAFLTVALSSALLSGAALVLGSTRTWSSYLFPVGLLLTGLAVSLAARTLQLQINSIRHQRYQEKIRRAQ